MIILAAGEGKRLRPLTNDIPKCMVKYNQKPIIEHIINSAYDCGLSNLSIVTGYKSEVLVEYLKNKNIKFFHNNNFRSTNMVTTLFNAKEFMDDDLIISYSDIVYDKHILKELINSKNKISLVVDLKWRELWQRRMENPLSDAETLKIKNGLIIELGKKPKSYLEIEGQYIGLIKISKEMIKDIILHYENLDTNAIYDGESFDNMYMTSFIQSLINNSFNFNPLFINGGWLEIDSINDLKLKIE